MPEENKDPQLETRKVKKEMTGKSKLIIAAVIAVILVVLIIIIAISTPKVEPPALDPEESIVLVIEDNVY